MTTKSEGSGAARNPAEAIVTTDVLETSLEKWSCDLLRSRGADPVKRGQDGELDREVFWGRGLHFWVEFKKSKTGRLRPSQAAWIKHKMPCGDWHYVVETKDQMEDIVLLWETTRGPATARKPSRT